MKTLQSLLPRAALFLLIFVLICGVAYTALATGLGQLFFPEQANGSLITVDGQVYGSALLAQPAGDERHLWGRILNLDVSTYTDENGNCLLYTSRCV